MKEGKMINYPMQFTEGKWVHIAFDEHEGVIYVDGVKQENPADNQNN